MNLTQSQKDTIIRAIKADTPWTLTFEEVQKAAYKLMSRRSQSMFRDNPKALKCLSLYFDNERLFKLVVVGDAPDAWRSGYDEYDSSRAKAFRKLEAAVRGCKTRAQFVKQFPEFSKYAPPELELNRLAPAVVNLAEELAAVGWKQTVFTEGSK